MFIHRSYGDNEVMMEDDHKLLLVFVRRLFSLDSMVVFTSLATH